MASTLIIGKDLPDCIDFAEALAVSGRTVFCAAKNDTEASKFESEGIYSATWNKSSAISAHSLLINAETKLNIIDEVIFYFDTNYFCSKFELDKSDEVSVAMDTMFSSFFFLANELIKRADQRKEKMTVSFLVKEYPSKCEVLSNSSKMPGVLPSSTIVSAAEASFMALAENFAANITDRDYLSVFLGKCSYTNELYKNERGIASWEAESFDAVKSMKNKQTIKQAANWNKVGSKVQTGFVLFK